MLKYWISYKIFIRKLYVKRTRGRNIGSDLLSFMILLFNILSIFILLENIFDLNGIVFASLNLNLPLAPLSMFLFAIFYFIWIILFPYRWNANSIYIIRLAYHTTSKYSRKEVFLTLGFTLSLLLIAIALNFII